MIQRKTAKRGSTKVTKTHRHPQRKQPHRRSSAQRAERAQPAAVRVQRKRDAHPDRVDVRDWFYQPTLSPLPDKLVNCHLVPEVLDQGSEGACTGFALAAVINFHLARRSARRRVSPRMLYEMARRYDEWPGEKYEGSSARGTMKGWSAHGVCSDKAWPHEPARSLTQAVAEEAALTPGGAYYRVMHRNIRDMHAALAEVGILYATLMVHAGWDRPGPTKLDVQYAEGGSVRSLKLPIIQRKGRADSGHAVAIVGYTTEGFVVQNSWGVSWGARGFALLPYEDFMLHATDVWVAQLGVPIRMTSWKQANVNVAGLHRATRAIPLADIRPYVIDVGNNGELSGSGTYWTSEADVQRLFEQVIPEKTAKWSKRRVVLYLHGGLNDEETVAERIVAYREVMLANEIYPLHVMWESGVWETLSGIFKDVFTDVDQRAGGVADWMNKVREGLIDAKDRSLELTVAGPGGALWREMKENARLASNHPDQRGGMHILAKHAGKALDSLAPAERARWEFHVVGHSAGSIFAAHALRHLVELGATFKSMQFLAPAITIESFKQLVLPYVQQRRCPLPSLYLLSDSAERDDDVGPYAKSLLYLVSNAFEQRRATPLLGMARFLLKDWEGSTDDVDAELAKLFAKKVDGRPAVVIAGGSQSAASRSRSETHGGFDDDLSTMNSVLHRILNAAPSHPFELRDLQFGGKAGARARVSEPQALRTEPVAGLQGAPANTQSRPWSTPRQRRRSA